MPKASTATATNGELHERAEQLADQRFSTGLIDYDNTLAKTEPIALANACKLLNDILKEQGSEFEYEVEAFIEAFPGLTFRGILTGAAEKHGFSLEPGEIDKLVELEKRTVISAVQTNGLEPEPESLRALAAFANQGRTLAVVSSSALERLEACVEAASQGSIFPKDRIFSGQTHVENPKPAPDVWLHAADALGAAIGDCFSVEDSTSGTISSRRAGIPLVIGYVGAYPPEEQNKVALKLLDNGADLVVGRWRHVEQAVRLIESGDTDRITSLLRIGGKEGWSRRAS